MKASLRGWHLIEVVREQLCGYWEQIPKWVQHKCQDLRVEQGLWDSRNRVAGARGAGGNKGMRTGSSGLTGNMNPHWDGWVGLYQVRL